VFLSSLSLSLSLSPCPKENKKMEKETTKKITKHRKKTKPSLSFVMLSRALASALASATRRAPSHSDIVPTGTAGQWMLKSRALSSSSSKRNASSADAAAASIDSASSSVESVEEFRGMVRDFALKEVAPHAEEIDKNNNFPKSVNLWRKMGEFGLHGELIDFDFECSHFPRNDENERNSQPRPQ